MIEAKNIQLRALLRSLYEVGKIPEYNGKEDQLYELFLLADNILNPAKDQENSDNPGSLSIDRAG